MYAVVDHEDVCGLDSRSSIAAVLKLEDEATAYMDVCVCMCSESM